MLTRLAVARTVYSPVEGCGGGSQLSVERWLVMQSHIPHVQIPRHVCVTESCFRPNRGTARPQVSPKSGSPLALLLPLASDCLGNVNAYVDDEGRLVDAGKAITGPSKLVALSPAGRDLELQGLHELDHACCQVQPVGHLLAHFED